MNVASDTAPRIVVALALALAMLGLAPEARAGQQRSSFGVSAQVVRPHDALLAEGVPMPLPGHVFHDDAQGRHYFFDGDMSAALAFYRAAMPQHGYSLVSDHAGTAAGHAMQWRRQGAVATVELRAVDGMAPTRVSVRAMLVP